MKDTAQNRAIMHANEIVPMSENRFLKDEMVAPSLQRETKHIPVLRGALASWRFSVERTPFRGDELTTLYNLAAARWTQRLNRLGFLKAYCLLMHKLLTDGPLSALPEGAWVLDAGTGTGALSLALESQYKTLRHGAPLMFSAIDRSPAMLKAARSEFDATRIDVALQRADICQLPYEDNSFDLVMAGHVVEHLPTPEAALRELVRVLQPGAPLLMLTTRRSLLGALVHLRWRVHRIRMQDLKAWLQDCGIVDIQFAELPGSPWCRHLSLICVGRKDEQAIYLD